MCLYKGGMDWYNGYSLKKAKIVQKDGGNKNGEKNWLSASIHAALAGTGTGAGTGERLGGRK